MIIFFSKKKITKLFEIYFDILMYDYIIYFTSIKIEIISLWFSCLIKNVMKMIFLYVIDTKLRNIFL